MEWFYEKNGEQHGPITEIDLKGMYGNGELTRSNLVWREGMADWTAFGAVFELEEGAPQKSASTIVPRSQRTQRGNSCGELRADAWDALSGNWLMAALVIFLMQVVMQASSMAAIIPLIGLLVPIFVAGPLTVGMYRYFLRLVRREPVEIGELFSGFTLWLKHTGLFLLVTFIIVCSAMFAAIPG
ncbi:MAG: GYF domain-containing protein, partial [Opitutales bacterium]|nr:GYF domain-containing protein [Opitutales bacterium]